MTYDGADDGDDDGNDDGNNDGDDDDGFEGEMMATTMKEF